MERFAVTEHNGKKYCYGINKPLFEGILQYSNSSPSIFHMPGHKQQNVFGECLDSNIVKLDVTEIQCTDNLHDPSGIIRNAQILAAHTFGADESFFIVNGSTAGVHAMILAVCNEGDKILIARDCHKSAVNALILSGAIPVYIAAGFDDSSCVPLPPTVEAVKAAIQKHPDAKAVFITRPSYYGICCNLKMIADIVHKAGMVLIADEAHGAHFMLSGELPEPALKCGADMCVQSLHKTLPSLTQSAILHVKSKRVDLERLKFFLKALQTSSPSYVLMSSIDCCRDFIDKQAEKLMVVLLERIQLLKKQLDELKNIKMLWELKEREFNRDYTRLVFNVSSTGLTGYKALHLLSKKYNLQAEMGDLWNIVCISTICDSHSNFEILAAALRSLEHLKDDDILCDKKQHQKHNFVKTTIKYLWGGDNLHEAVPPRQAFKYAWDKIKYLYSQGRISCGIITPYPPGIPIIMPGEVIKKEQVSIISSILDNGGVVEGIDNEGYIVVAKK